MRMRKKKCTPKRLMEYKDFFIDLKDEKEVSFYDILEITIPYA